MLTFERFEIAPGWCLDGEVLRGAVSVVRLAVATPPEGWVENFLLDPTARRGGGVIRLSEVVDGRGEPARLDELQPEVVRAFLARFAGFVLGDGGLIETLTVRENLLLPALYHDVRFGSTREVEAGVARALQEMAEDAGALPKADLDACPGELPTWRRRQWGWARTLVRRPQLVIGFSPFAGLPQVTRHWLTSLLRGYRNREPGSAHLYFLTEPDEAAGCFGAGVRELLVQPLSDHESL